ncbi:hypothetical protein [Bacteriovorax sp. Seq25_V]|uniref:hypothetical protein n=1 Tax=Bacteriovorax sp. Seq25_V TaxID=1201288 RepID=UPI000389E0DE|nr:hypothetical protein [Bacteriovorax sp. Seq25_V]EQC47203.1 hypothetical protein M900_0905 [Bacteriovorax sp. Seq25_V]
MQFIKLRYFFQLILLLVLSFDSINYSAHRKISSTYSTRPITDISCREALDQFFAPNVVEDNVILWHEFKSNEAIINPKYSMHEDFENLAADPDHNFTQTHTSQLEAVSGIYARERGVITANIIRGPEGTEFVDADGIFWDVKTPVSPQINDRWEFDIDNVGTSIKTKLESKDNINILVDLSYMRVDNRAHLRSWIEANISENFQNRIKFISVPDAIIGNH